MGESIVVGYAQNGSGTIPCFTLQALPFFYPMTLLPHDQRPTLSRLQQISPNPSRYAAMGDLIPDKAIFRVTDPVNHIYNFAAVG